MNEQEMTTVLLELAGKVKKDMGTGNLAIIGIERRGAILAKRLANILQESRDVPTGFLDITLYRDDFSKIGSNPIVSETKIPFDLNDRKILLIDDVLFTGRTVRAALDEIIDFGRPSLVRLFVLVDRGHRELPITCDFAGKTLKTKKTQMVEVHVKELDGKDEVIIVGA